MKEKDVLNLFGEIEDTYIADAVRSQNVVARPRRWLVNAAAVLALVCMMGCGVAYAYNAGWFVDFFRQRSGEPLSVEQIQQIESHQIPVGQAQMQDGWSVELNSVMSDGAMGYVLLRVTAPEGVNIDARWHNGRMTSMILPGNAGREGGRFPVEPVGGDYLATCAFSWEEDGDGCQNTCILALEILPRLTTPGDPFGKDVTWNIYLDALIRESFDATYFEELENGKYRDQAPHEYTQEEKARLYTTELLTEGTWEFAVNFTPEMQDTQWIELLDAPIRTKTRLVRRTGIGTEQKTIQTVEDDLTVTSIRLSTLSLALQYDYDDAVTFLGAPGSIRVFMKDGTEVDFKAETSGLGYSVVKATAPIVLENVDYVILPDGTQIDMP